MTYATSSAGVSTHGDHVQPGAERRPSHFEVTQMIFKVNGNRITHL